jgi:predicted cobalt transporter CbtA
MAAPDKAMEKAQALQVLAAARFERAEGTAAANLHAAAARVAAHLRQAEAPEAIAGLARERSKRRSRIPAINPETTALAT